MLVEGVTDWFEKNVPLVGDKIAQGISKFSDELEKAVSPISNTVSNIKNTVNPYIEKLTRSLQSSLNDLRNRVDEVISPTVETAFSIAQSAKQAVDNLNEALKEFIKDPSGYISKHLPTWITNGISILTQGVNDLFKWINEKGEGLISWVENAQHWWLEQFEANKEKLVASVWIAIYPKIKWIYDIERTLLDFLSNPQSFIEKRLPGWVKELPKRLSELWQQFTEFVNNVTNAFLHIDDFLLRAIEDFIIGLIKWFFGTLIDDLAHLKYDPKKREVIGKPKNPITTILITFMRIEKPENPYATVKKDLEVRKLEHRVS